MKKKPFVSIIIPYFKKKIYFKKTIASIKSQSYKNYEIIIVYDDQNLNELTFVKNELKKIKHKKIIINKKNIGVGSSRNKGIINSKGEYIAFCDADDIWEKNKLSNQIYFMQNKKIDFSYTSYLIINKYSKIIGRFNAQKKINYNNLIKSCDIGLSTVIGSKKIFLRNKFTSLKTKEDYLLWLQILKKRRFIFGIDQYLSSWRLVENSLSSSLIQKLSDAFRLYHNYERYNFIISIFFVLRLIFFALFKKIKIYFTNNSKN